MRGFRSRIRFDILQSCSRVLIPVVKPYGGPCVLANMAAGLMTGGIPSYTSASILSLSRPTCVSGCKKKSQNECVTARNIIDSSSTFSSILHLDYRYIHAASAKQRLQMRKLKENIPSEEIKPVWGVEK
ncbi:hypothetical protein AOLI_G00192710 [Acnodon oligacanthus]